jgi:hypothetical protein
MINMEVEVNGVKYQSIEKTKRGPASKKLFQLAMINLVFGGDLHGTLGYSRPAPNCDVVKEYGLIQLKQSKLSRADREWVVYNFENNFKRVD